MNVLAGLYRQEAGTILVNGEPKVFSSPRDAINAGIGMVHQHFMLVPSQTVTENILLGLDDPRFFLRLPDYDNKIADLGEKFGLKVDPRAKVWQLSVGNSSGLKFLKCFIAAWMCLSWMSRPPSLRLRKSKVYL